MATQLRKLTGMGSDVRKIAALLQSKAPKGHKLAYINDEEAALLKRRGGSGKPHADTGIPSFDDGTSGGGIFSSPDYSQYTPQQQAPVEATPAAAPADTGAYTGGGVQTPAVSSSDTSLNLPSSGGSSFGAQLGQNLGGVQAPSAGTAFATPQLNAPSAAYDITSSNVPVATAPTGQEPGITDKLSQALGVSNKTLGNLGVAGLTAYLGSRQAKAAAQGGQAAAQQQQALAAPYQAKGTELQRQAEAGELTPVGQQQLQAVQAQAAQAAESRGGVGAQQVQAQVEAYRQQLLSQQYNLGLQISGIGDQIALGAIKTGMQADQYVNQLTSNYYTNIARTLAGGSPQVATPQSATGGNA